MNAVEYAKAAIEEKAAKLIEEQRKGREEAEHATRQKLEMQMKIDSTIEEFDGEFGLSYHDGFLWKDDKRIASVNVGWERWVSPNYEYKVEESGFVYSWTVNGISNWATKYENFVKYFGEAIAKIV